MEHQLRDAKRRRTEGPAAPQLGADDTKILNAVVDDIAAGRMPTGAAFGPAVRVLVAALASQRRYHCEHFLSELLRAAPLDEVSAALPLLVGALRDEATAAGAASVLFGLELYSNVKLANCVGEAPGMIPALVNALAVGVGDCDAAEVLEELGRTSIDFAKRIACADGALDMLFQWLRAGRGGGVAARVLSAVVDASEECFHAVTFHAALKPAMKHAISSGAESIASIFHLLASFESSDTPFGSALALEMLNSDGALPAIAALLLNEDPFSAVGPLLCLERIATSSAAAARLLVGSEPVLEALSAAVCVPEGSIADHGNPTAAAADAATDDDDVEIEADYICQGKHMRASCSSDLLTGLLSAAGPGAIAAAFAPHLSCDDAEVQDKARACLTKPPLSLAADLVDAVARTARRAAARKAALRAQVAELEAVPINTRAAIVDLAAAVRGPR